MGFEDANRGYLYYDGKIFNDKVVSYELIVGSRHYWREMRVVNVPQGAYVSIL